MTYEERMMLVDLRDTSLSGFHRNKSVSLEGIPHLLTQERVLPELGSDDHPRPCKQLLRRLRSRRIRIRKLISIDKRIQLLLFDEMGVVARYEV